MRAAATRHGSNAIAIAITTGLKEGELIIAARVMRVLTPLTSRPWAMGVAQFVHTPAGAPISAPHATFAAADWNPLRFACFHRPNPVIAAAPNGSAKYIPKRFVHSQFTVVRPIRSGSGIAGVTFSNASNEIAPATCNCWPECNFFQQRRIALRAPEDARDRNRQQERHHNLQTGARTNSARNCCFLLHRTRPLHS